MSEAARGYDDVTLKNGGEPDDGCVPVGFAPNQKLPPGYQVLWLDGHYFWTDGTHDSDITVNRWSAWRGAWIDYHRRGDSNG